MPDCLGGPCPSLPRCPIQSLFIKRSPPGLAACPARPIAAPPCWRLAASRPHPAHVSWPLALQDDDASASRRSKVTPRTSGTHNLIVVFSIKVSLMGNGFRYGFYQTTRWILVPAAACLSGNLRNPFPPSALSPSPSPSALNRPLTEMSEVRPVLPHLARSFSAVVGACKCKTGHDPQTRTVLFWQSREA